jgi:hypothetical protein
MPIAAGWLTLPNHPTEDLEIFRVLHRSRLRSMQGVRVSEFLPANLPLAGGSHLRTGRFETVRHPAQSFLSLEPVAEDDFPPAGGAPFDFLKGGGFRRGVARAAPSNARLNSRSGVLRLSFHCFFDARVR